MQRLTGTTYEAEQENKIHTLANLGGYQDRNGNIYGYYTSTEWSYRNKGEYNPHTIYGVSSGKKYFQISRSKISKQRLLQFSSNSESVTKASMIPGGLGFLSEANQTVVTKWSGRLAGAAALVQGAAEQTMKESITAIRKGASIIGSERAALKTIGSIGKYAKFLGNATGFVSAADHLYKTINASTFEEGLLNFGKFGVDLLLIHAKSNPLVLTVSVGYGILDAAGYLDFKKK